MKVLISGAGMGGLALAAFLRETSIEFDIVEKAKDFEHQGFLIGMWDNGRRILQKLRLAERFDEEGERVRLYSIRDGSGRVLRDYDLHRFYGNFGIAMTLIERKKLHALLLEAIPGEKIRMETSIESLEESEGGVLVRFSDGSSAAYDAVIGADGIHSKVRELSFGKDIESYEGWRAWYSWVDNKYAQRQTILEYIEPREFVLLMNCKGRTLAMFIAPADHRIWDKTEGRMEMLKCTFKDECLLMPDMLEKLREGEIMPTDLADVHMRRWTKGKVALMGDAAHSFGAMAGFGTSMALEDAYVLAAELMRVENSSDISHALSTYEKRRRGRVHTAKHLGERMRHWALIRSPQIRAFVNFVMPMVPEKYFTSDYFKLLQEEI